MEDRPITSDKEVELNSQGLYLPEVFTRLSMDLKNLMHTGRHFLQIPGPTNVPDRILRAMDRQVIDHRSAEFSKLASEVLEKHTSDLPDQRACNYLSGLGYWSMGSGNCEYAFCRRSCVDV